MLSLCDIVCSVNIDTGHIYRVLFCVALNFLNTLDSVGVLEFSTAPLALSETTMACSMVITSSILKG